VMASMSVKRFEMPEVGEVEVHKHPKATRISLKLRIGDNPKVVIPKSVDFFTGYAFALEKRQWILDKQKTIQEHCKNRTLYTYEKGFSCRFFNLDIEPAMGTEAKVIRNGGIFTLQFPMAKEIESENSQQQIQTVIAEILRLYAKKYLPERVKELAQKNGFNYNKVFVKNLKSKWGSCSAQKNINLNVHLLRLPEYLSDFIILHELCHTKHMNHGPAFHDLLNSLCGDEKQLNRELKQYSLRF
jgi:predicted metal-dependent hydrolase